MSTGDTPILFKDETPLSAPKAIIGLILLSSDEIGEKAFSSIMPTEVTVVSTRVAYEVTDGLLSLCAPLKDTALTLPPEGRLDVLAFSCTSGSVALGVASVLGDLEMSRPGIKYTTPAIACIEALNHRAVKRFALLTPYGVDTHKSFLPFFRNYGFDVVRHGAFAKTTDAEIGSISRDALFSAARDLTKDGGVDALFISCTGVQIVPHIEDLERELGIHVISSSQAMAWHTLKLINYHAPITGFGKLLAEPR